MLCPMAQLVAEQGQSDQGDRDMAKAGKRNSECGSRGQRPGVGGRQVDRGQQVGGGGYPDICNIPQPGLQENGAGQDPAADDPRLAELVEMGLPDQWIEVAHAIGFDAFLTMWFVLDRDNLGRSCRREAKRMWIPQTIHYFRYQRNLYIKTLAAEGLSIQSIRERVISDLGEEVSERSIYRIAIDPGPHIGYFKKNVSSSPDV